MNFVQKSEKSDFLKICINEFSIKVKKIGKINKILIKKIFYIIIKKNEHSEKTKKFNF